MSGDRIGPDRRGRCPIPLFDQTLEDWPTVKKRWEAFWEQGLYDRPLLQVTAPRDGAPPAEGLDVDPETQWTNVDFMIHRTLETIRTTYYGGEAIPWFWDPISAGYALLFGCVPHFSKATMYVDPAPTGPDGFPSLSGWRDSPWWPWMRDGTAKAARLSEGRYFVLPFWGNHAVDILAVVRGGQDFLMDVALHPAWVGSALREMTGIFYEIYEELWQYICPDAMGLEGSLDYCGCWSPGRALAFDADMAYGVSSIHFRELMLPALLDWMGRVDHTIWHLDGKGSITHLDTLLALPEIDAIQWVQGAGAQEILQWVPLIRRIQRGGKSVQVICQPKEVVPVLGEIRPEGLTISTRCETEGEARALVRKVSELYS
jgi:5-methyltetrahydrofolate--homocysteine methyltransferase